MRIYDRFLQIYANPLDRWLALAALALCVSAWAAFGSTKSPSVQAPSAESSDVGSPDLWIPEGHVLVPLQLENASSLETILGSFGIVDIYRLRGIPGEVGQLLGPTVKIIRSPEDPQQWSALIPRHEASRWVPDGSRFFAVVQNRERPQQNSMLARKPQPSSRRWNIEYFERSP